MANISYENTADAVYDPYDHKYSDIDSIERELNRTFDLCNGCRLCFKYCPSFPSLFKAMDRTQADVSLLTEKEKATVIGECYQCRICYVVCPYTKTDKHPYQINFPALMLRAKILAAKRKGIGLRERLLGNPDALGRLNSGWLSGLVNWSMKNSFHRSLMHSILGIHKRKLMPSFHRVSFARWFRKHSKRREQTVSVQSDKKVVLFSTCFVNYNNPQVGKDTVAVLEKNKVLVEHPSQNCCGMPALDSGDMKLALKKMKRNLRLLIPYVEQGYKILAINPSCSLTLKQEYINFLPPDKGDGKESWRKKAEKISAATMDVNEYLFELKKEGTFNTDFKSKPGKVAYHVPCHLRAQNIGFRSRDMMRLIPDTTVNVTAECCGHDGTWAMKKEFFDMSLQAGKKAFSGLKEQGANEVATDCPLAAIQLQQGMEVEKRPVHPVQILAKAYHPPEKGGFPDALTNKSEVS